jgi:hypothetical protein
MSIFKIERVQDVGIYNTSFPVSMWVYTSDEKPFIIEIYCEGGGEISFKKYLEMCFTEKFGIEADKNIDPIFKRFNEIIYPNDTSAKHIIDQLKTLPFREVHKEDYNHENRGYKEVVILKMKTIDEFMQLADLIYKMCSPTRIKRFKDLHD